MAINACDLAGSNPADLVSPHPERRGFGSLLIEQVLAEDFGGKVSLSYAPEGLRFELTTRLSNLPDQGPRIGA